MRFRGDDSERDAQIARIRSTAGIQVVDSSPKMLLVDSADDTIAELQKTLPDWTIVPEHIITQPGPVLPE